MEEKLCCPVCKNEYVHIKSATTKAIEKGTEKELQSVSVEFYCEEGHKWVSNLEFHEGNTLANMCILPIAWDRCN